MKFLVTKKEKKAWSQTTISGSKQRTQRKVHGEGSDLSLVPTNLFSARLDKCYNTYMHSDTHTHKIEIAHTISTQLLSHLKNMVCVSE